MSEKEHLSRRQSDLSPAKQALLKRWMRGENTTESRIVPRRTGSAPTPLSFAQQRLWFLDQLEPNSSFYNIPVALRLSGSLDVVALERSLNEIVRRHEALRTVFTTVEARPVQVIASQLSLALVRQDLRALPNGMRETEAQQQAHQIIRRPFDLSREPLLRAHLLHLADTEYVLILTIHHIVADGWSMGVLVRELVAVYQAYSTGMSSPLPDLPIQYADFAHWQREWLQGTVLETHLTYWKQHLSGAPAVLALPADYPRPAIQTFRGATQLFTLPKELTDAVKTLGQQEGVTLFVILLAAFKTLLYRYTHQEDIVVGSPIANRTRLELEGLIGCFVNTLALRTQLSADLHFRELLRQMHAVVLGAQAHQDLPFEQLVEALQPERDLSHTPLFQVMFGLQNAPMPVVEVAGLTLSPFEIDSGTAKFDLELQVWDTPSGLCGRFEYNTDLFDAATIVRMVSHLQTLLEGIIADPAQRLADLPLLTRTEHQQLSTWNQTQVDYPQNVALHQLFAAQVERTPDAVALIFEGRSLTYRELDARTNQLAHYLQTFGVGSDVLVGICMERSFELVIGLLGTLKAGGAYVPLEPTYPPARLAATLEDAQISVLLTQARLVEQLPAHQAQLICLDTDWDRIAREQTVSPVSAATADHLAYVIYTSGSTGRPKGVMNTHRGICNRLLWMQDAYQLTTADRVLQKTPFSFDVSVWEFFWPLLTGAQLIVAQPEGHKDSAYLVKLINEQQITTIHFVPSMLQVFLEEPGLEQCDCLKRVICSGEALPVSLQERCFARLDVELHNLYGPTEAAVDVTFWRCQHTQVLHQIPIGYPIANTQIHLLDRHLHPVPVGVSGELHIGGVGVARGYLNQPELTAEKFIPDPFSEVPGARLYKTGDLARYLPDGAIEFLGRIDFQVKIRGFRIELGEVETVLGQHPQVHQAVVVARGDISGDRRLVGYVVPEGEQQPTTSELRQFLQSKLPEYMVPAAIVFLEALPLTANGKVDRKALPLPDRTRPEPESSFVAPRNSVEELLVKIWTQTLYIEQISVHDNFFDLGGDSILCIQIIMRANEAGLYLTTKQLFQHQTIAELATAVEITSVIQADPDPTIDTIPLTPLQHWFFEQNFPAPNLWHQTVLLELPNDLAPSFLEEAIKQVLIHHDALSLHFRREGSSWRQVRAESNKIIPFTQVHLSGLPEDVQRAAIKVIAAELPGSLNLSQGPLVWTVFFNLAPQRANQLLLLIHSLIVDSISWSILLEDIHTAYQQLSQGNIVQLPPEGTSFRKWLLELIENAQSTEMQRTLPYWLRLSQIPPPCLPVDYPDGIANNTEASTSVVSVALSTEETQVLLQDANRVYRTQASDLLLTSLAQAISRWASARYLLVDLTNSMRDESFADTNSLRIVGCFTYLFPVLLDSGEEKTSGDLLKSIKEQLRKIPNYGISYGLLRYLSVDDEIAEQLRTLPQSEIIFHYQSQPDQITSTSPLFRRVQESRGFLHGLQEPQCYLLEISATITEGRLQVDWAYSNNVFNHSTIERLAKSHIDALQTLIAHCQSTAVGSYTPSDFPLANLNQQALDELISVDQQIEDIYPLAPMQEHMLFHYLSAMNPELYDVHVIVPLRGTQLNVAAFEQAWQQIIDRHPVLRTYFIWKNLDKPYQVVSRSVKVSVEQQDWSGLPSTEQEERLTTFLRTLRHQGFELSKAPHTRLSLLRLAEDNYQFIWSFNYILQDGWSLPLIMKDFFILYESFCRNQELHMESLRHYRDYIAWIRQQDLSEAETFWRKMLKGARVPTPLISHTSKRVSNREKVYAEQQISLSVITTTALHSLARQQGLTLYTLLQGAWALLLSCYSDEEVVVFGNVISSRPPTLVGSENMVGFFNNFLPIRIEVFPERSLLVWMKEIQALQVELRQYDYSPIAKISEWVGLPENHPLFESYMVFEHFPFDPSVAITSSEWGLHGHYFYTTTEHPLRIEIWPQQPLVLVMRYYEHHFENATITRMLEDFKTILTNITADNKQSIGDLMHLIKNSTNPAIEFH